MDWSQFVRQFSLQPFHLVLWVKIRPVALRAGLIYIQAEGSVLSSFASETSPGRSLPPGSLKNDPI